MNDAALKDFRNLAIAALTLRMYGQVDLAKQVEGFALQVNDGTVEYVD